MKTPRNSPREPRGSRLAFLAAAALPTLALCLALPIRGAAAEAPGEAVPVETPPVQLAETRPVETTLGNPELPAVLDVWLAMIAGANRSLDLEQFYLAHWPGEPLGPVLDAIGAAASRGVRVRVLLDRGMHATYPWPADSLATVPGIEVRLVDLRERAGGIQHAKLILVDGRETFLGSQNLDWRALKHIHELGVRVRDPRLAAAFGGVFEMDWAAADPAPGSPGHGNGAGESETDTRRREAAIARARDRARAAATEAPFVLGQAPGDTVRIIPGWSPLAFNPDSTHWDRKRIVDLLDAAEHDVAIQLLSYGIEGRGYRDLTIDDALRRAAKRGVHVRLLVSDWQAGGDGMAAVQSLAEVPRLDVRMISIPEWSGGYIPYARVQHCKFLVVDGEAVWIGTSNWAPSYWLASRNLSVTLENRRLAAQVMTTFERSWNDPGTAAVDPAAAYEAKIHGDTPPRGRAAYGR